MRPLILAASALIGLGCTGRSEASLIYYTESITTDGVLDGTAFTGKLVTLTLAADTSTVTFFQGGGFTRYSNAAASATISVAGVGVDTMSDDYRVQVEVYSTFDDFLVNDLTQGVDIFDTFTTAGSLVGVDLTQAFGPVSGGASYALSTPFTTSLGSFSFTNGGGGISSASASTPEPSSLLMTAMGGVCLLLKFRRRPVRA